MDAFEDQVGYHAVQGAAPGLSQLHIFRTDDHIHRAVSAKACVHAGEDDAEDVHYFILQHGAGEDVAVTDKISNKGVGGLVVDIFRCPDLLDVALVHDYDGIGHGQRFFLIMGHIDEGDAKLILHADQLVLHFLPEFQIQGAQWFVQKQDLRLVDDGPGDGDPLLLPAAQRIGHALLIALQIDQLQCIFDLVIDIGFALAADLQAEGDILGDVHVGEQGVFLKYGVQLPFVRRKGSDVFASEDHAALIRSLESAQDPQGGRLPASAGAQERQKFIFIKIQVQVVQNLVSVVDLGNVLQFDQSVAHCACLLW